MSPLSHQGCQYTQARLLRKQGWTGGPPGAGPHLPELSSETLYCKQDTRERHPPGVAEGRPTCPHAGARLEVPVPQDQLREGVAPGPLGDRQGMAAGHTP